MNEKRSRPGEAMAKGNKTELERQADNDAIAKEYLDIAHARMDRMKITLAEAMAATFYVLQIDYFESREIGEKTFTGEFDSRRGRNKRRREGDSKEE